MFPVSSSFLLWLDIKEDINMASYTAIVPYTNFPKIFFHSILPATLWRVSKLRNPPFCCNRWYLPPDKLPKRYHVFWITWTSTWKYSVQIKLDPPWHWKPLKRTNQPLLRAFVLIFLPDEEIEMYNAPASCFSVYISKQNIGSDFLCAAVYFYKSLGVPCSDTEAFWFCA